MALANYCKYCGQKLHYHDEKLTAECDDCFYDDWCYWWDDWDYIY